MNSELLAKLNKIDIPCSTTCKCGNEDFTITKLDKFLSYYLARVKCKKCGHMMDMELHTTELEDFHIMQNL